MFVRKHLPFTTSTNFKMKVQIWFSDYCDHSDYIARVICLSAILLAMLNTIRKIAEACLSKLLFAGPVSSYQSNVSMDLDILTVSLFSSYHLK